MQKTTDPAAVTSSSTEEMAVYFTALKGTAAADTVMTGNSWPDSSENGANGHGIWRAMAMPSGLSLVPDGFASAIVSVYGVDLVASSWSWDPLAEPPVGFSSDLVAPSNESSTIVYGGVGTFGDPDPVELPDATWAVFTIGVEDADGWKFLCRFVGAAHDGGREWSHAF